MENVLFVTVFSAEEMNDYQTILRDNSLGTFNFKLVFLRSRLLSCRPKNGSWAITYCITQHCKSRISICTVGGKSKRKG